MANKPSSVSFEQSSSVATLGNSLAGVAALLLSTAVLLMGNGLQGTLIPIRGNIESFQFFELGLLGTGYFCGFIFGCVTGPLLLRRGGHIRTFMAMASTASVMPLLHSIALEPLIWSLFRAITGYCFAVLYIVIESWLNERTTNEHRGAIFSIYTIINLTVITIGQMMISLDDPALFGLFAVASILVSLATVPVAFTKVSAPASPSFVMPNLMELYRNSPVGFAGCLAVGLANGAFWTLGPVFAQKQGLDVTGVGLFMSMVVIGGAITQWPLGKTSDRIDRRIVIVASAVIASIASIIMALLPSNTEILVLIAGACFGAGAFPIYSLAVAHANDHASPSEMVKISSGLLLVYGLGAAIGPLIPPILENVITNSALFAFTGSVYVLFALIVVWRMRRRAPISDEDRVSFNDSIISAQTVSQVVTDTILTEGEPVSREVKDDDVQEEDDYVT